MGAWGVALYSNDFAKDVSASVKAVSRLPFEPATLLEYLCQVEPRASNDPKDTDHTLFWLVVADQFVKRGVDCPPARERALAIIADGTDLAAMRSLGMDEVSLAKRRAMLDELRTRIAAPMDALKPRTVLKKPQKLLLDAGETLIYPVCKGKPINPYAVGKDWAWVKAWRQDAWGALAIVERGLMFDFLAWYRPMVLHESLSTEPTPDALSQPRIWQLRSPGTLTANHHKNMQLKSLGNVPVSAGKLDQLFPRRPSPLSWVVSDISLCNDMGVRLLTDKPLPQIAALADLA